MSVKILALVKSCAECPHKQYYSGSVYECSMVQQKLVADVAMPFWCPLPDHPAVHIAPAQRAVSTTRDILTQLKKEIAEGASEARIREIVDFSLERLPTV